MTPVSDTDLRQNLARWMDRAVESGDALLVARQEAKSVAMLSPEGFEGWVETVHLLRSPRNAERLLRAAAVADAGGATEKDLLPDAP